MSDAEWEDAYHSAWQAYYTPEHVRTILKRTAAHPLGLVKSIFSTLLWFNTMIPIEGVHPLEGGMIRMKHRRDRRSGMPIESPFSFYPRYAVETLSKFGRYFSVWRQYKKIYKEVIAAPDRLTYQDMAIAAPKDDEFEALDLYHATSGGEAALARKRRDDIIRARPTPAAAPSVAAE
jgi:hypothetical protein